MSGYFDSKVVSMEFDNKKFEKNVSQSLKSIDKLKSSLNFSDSRRAFEELEQSSRSVNFSHLTDGIENVKVKISGLQVAAIAMMDEFARTIYRTGKAFVKDMAFGQITSGWSKFAEKAGSVQTIMNTTGESIETVYNKLDDLMWYADETSFSFDNMTKAVSSFTAVGTDLGKATKMVMGVADMVAFAGPENPGMALQSALMNLAQSYSTGRLQLMDWKSIQNQRIDTPQFRRLFIDSAKKFGTLTEEGLNQAGKFVGVETFTSELASGFANQEVIEDALIRAAEFSEAVRKEVKRTGKTAKEAMKDLEDNFDEVTVKAFRAAQESKSLREAIDAVKTAIGTQWTTTFEYIFGDFEQAKQTWELVYDTLYDIFGVIGENRNLLLRPALTSGWEQLRKVLSDSEIALDDFYDTYADTLGIGREELLKMVDEAEGFDAFLKKAPENISAIEKTVRQLAGSTERTAKVAETAEEKLERYKNVMASIWRGELGIGEERFQKLTEAGYDYQAVQELINKYGLGYSMTIEDVIDLQDSFTKSVSETGEEMNGTIDELNAFISGTSEAGLSLTEVLDLMTKQSGRELIFESLSNVLNFLVSIVENFREAWDNMFPPMTSKKLYEVLEHIRDLTSHLEMTEEEAEKLQRAFGGVLSILKIFTTLTGGAVKRAFKLIASIIGNANINLLDMAANIGDAITKFKDWLLVDNPIFNAIVKLAESVKNLINAFLKLPGVKNSISNFTSFLSKSFQTGVEWMTKAIDNVTSFIEKLNGFEGISEKEFADFFTSIIDSAKAALHFDFSKIGVKIGNELITMQSIIYKIKNPITVGVRSTFDKITETVLKANGKLEGAFGKLKEFISNLDFSDIFSMIVYGEMALITMKLYELTGAFAGMANSIKTFFNALTTSIKEAGKAANMVAFGAAVAMIAGSIYMLAQLEWGGETHAAEKAAGAVAGIIILLVAGMKILAAGKGVDGAKLAGLALAMVAMAGSVLLIVYALRLLHSIEDWSEYIPAIVALISIVAGIFAVTKAISKVTTSSKGAKGFAVAIIALTFSLLLMAAAIKLYASIPIGELVKGLFFVRLAMGIIKKGLKGLQKAGEGNYFQLGVAIVAIVGSLLILYEAIKLYAKMDSETFWVGASRLYMLLLAIGFFVAGISAAMRTTMGEAKDISKVGSLLISMAFALLVLTAAISILGVIPLDILIQGGIAAAALMIAMAESVKIMGKGASGVQTGAIIGLIMMMVALTGLVIALGYIKDWKKLGAGLIGVSILLVALGESFKRIGQVTYNRRNWGVVAELLIFMFAMLAYIQFVSEAAKNIDNINSFVAVIGAISVLAIVMGVASEFITKSASRMSPESFVAAGNLVMSMGALIFALAVIAAGIAWVSTYIQGDLASMGELVGIITILAALATAMTTVLAPALKDVTKSHVTSIFVTLQSMALFLLELTAIATLLALVSMIPLNVKNMYSLTGVMAILAAISTGMIYVLSPALKGITKPRIRNMFVALQSMALFLLELTAIATLLALASMIPLNVDRMYELVGVMTALAVIASGMALVSAAIGRVPGKTIQNGANQILLIAAKIAGFVILLVGVMSGIGALVNLLSDKQADAIVRGLEIFNRFMSTVASGIGEAVSALISGVGIGFMDSAVIMGERLKELGVKIVEFGDIMAGFNPLAAIGTILAAKAIAALAGAVTSASIAKFLDVVLPGNFKKNLEQWAEALGAFADGISDIQIDPTQASSIGIIAGAVADLAGAFASGSAWDFIMKLAGNESSFETFGSSVKKLGEGIIEVVKAANAMGDVDQSKIDAFMSVASSIADLAKSFGHATIWDALLKFAGGEDAFTSFTKNLTPFTDGVKALAEAADTTTVDLPKVDTFVKAAERVVAFAKAITGDGDGLDNILKAVAVDIAFDAFKRNVEGFCDGIVALNNKAVLIATSYKPQNIDNMISIANKIQDFLPLLIDDGVIKAFAEEIAFGAFSSNLSEFGKGLSAFSTAASKASPSDAEQAVATATSVVDFMKTLDNDFIDRWKEKLNISAFSDNAWYLGWGIRNFAEATKGYVYGPGSTASNAVTLLDSLASAATLVDSMGSTSKLQSFSSTLTGVGADIAGFVGELSGLSGGGLATALTAVQQVSSTIIDASPAFTSSGKSIFSAIALGMRNNKTAVQSAAAQAVQAIITYFANSASEFINEGKNIMHDLENGMLGEAYKFKQIGKQLRDKFAEGFGATNFTVTVSDSGAPATGWDYTGGGGRQPVGTVMNLSASPMIAAYDLYGDMDAGFGMTSYASASPAAFAIQNGIMGRNQGSISAAPARTNRSDLNRLVELLAELLSDGITAQPVIAPVLDDSGFKSQLNTTLTSISDAQNRVLPAMSSVAARSSYNSVSAKSDLISGDTDIIGAINDVRSSVDKLSKDVANMQMVLDDGTLVGKIAGKMDASLGTIATRKARQNFGLTL